MNGPHFDPVSPAQFKKAKLVGNDTLMKCKNTNTFNIYEDGVLKTMCIGKNV